MFVVYRGVLGLGVLIHLKICRRGSE